MKNLITSETQVREVLRIRPMASELLAKTSVNFWNNPSKPLADLFRNKPMGKLIDLVEEIGNLPVPAEDCLWKELPIAYLLDFLTQNHRDFYLNFVNDIEYMFDLQSAADPKSSLELRSLFSDFRKFVAELQSITELEETQIFPRVLRYEACLQDPRVHPEFQKGSLQIVIANRMSRFSFRRKYFFPAFLERVGQLGQNGLDPSGTITLIQRLEEFHAELLEHELLEFDTLFPMALEMERTLYNLSIEGAPITANRVRGPMDSGIVRLRSL